MTTYTHSNPVFLVNAYLRVEGVQDLYERISSLADVEMLEPLTQQSYGDAEFVIRDLNGYVLVFSQ